MGHYDQPMSKVVSPSRVIHAFVSEIRDTYPENEKAKVDAYTDRIKTSTSAADHRRGHRCIIWAMHLAEEKSESHPKWQEIKQLHKEWKDTELAAFFGAGDMIRIVWAQNAADVARTIGEEDGWDKAPWEELLQELLDMDGA